MRPAPGTVLGSYVVRAHLGAGGMGDVYRAEDTRLGREVALKMLNAVFASHPGAASRLAREARVLAALDHPGIAAIHGMEEIEGRRFLVLELVPGDTLAERIARGPMPWPEALRVTVEIARALAAAHERGVVHRDLKPANVKIRPDGRVAVLDFGLATAAAEMEAGDPDAETMVVTQSDALLGTPAYMSPEQAGRRAVDGRTDLWALGAVLFECLAGVRPFPGDSLAETFAAILERAPRWDLLPPAVPPRVRALLERALEKDPARRWSRAVDVIEALEAALEDPGAPADGEGFWGGLSRRMGRWLPGRPPAAAGKPVREAAPAGRVEHRLSQETFDEAIESGPAWSPSGGRLAFCREVGAVRKIFVKTAGADDAQPVTRGPHDDLQAAWAGEGVLLFLRGRSPGRRVTPGDLFGAYFDADVWSLELETGREARLLENAYHPAPSPDGRWIAVDASWAGPRRIWRVDHHGRNPQQITSDSSEAVWHLRPRWSPDSNRIVFQSVERTRFNIRTVDLKRGELSWLTQDVILNVEPAWSPRGDAVIFSSYRAGGINLWRVPVDGRGKAAGSLEQITSGAGQDIEAAPSPDGSRLAFTILRQNAALWRLPVDPRTGRPGGAPEKVIASSRESSRGAWSPDGTRIAFNSDRTGDMNLWVHELAGGTSLRVTAGPGGDYQPAWSPDGSRLAFFSSREGKPGLWTVELDSGRLHSLATDGAIEVNPFFSPDGALLAYHSDRDGRLEVWVRRADGGEPRQLTWIGVSGHFLRWSRDGKHVVFRTPSEGGGLRRISREGGDPEPLPPVKGGSHISLSPDEQRIMDVTEHRTLWVSPLDGGPPERVYEFEDPDVRIDYPVWSPDGRWVLFDRLRPQGGDIWLLEGLPEPR